MLGEPVIFTCANAGCENRSMKIEQGSLISLLCQSCGSERGSFDCDVERVPFAVVDDEMSAVGIRDKVAANTVVHMRFDGDGAYTYLWRISRVNDQPSSIPSGQPFQKVEEQAAVRAEEKTPEKEGGEIVEEPQKKGSRQRLKADG